MRLSAVILLLSLGFATTGRAQTPAIQTKIDNQLNLKRLQGAWVPAFLITEAGLEAYPVQGRMMVIQNLDFARFDGQKNVQSGTLTFYPGDGASIDFNLNDRLDWDLERANFTPDKLLRKQKALFKIDGDVLTVAYPVPGRHRPDDLKAGPHRQVIVYNRAVEKVPEAKGPDLQPTAKDSVPEPKGEVEPTPAKQPRKRNRGENP